MSSASELLLHLRPCPLIVEFEGVAYTIGALDAVDWLVLVDHPHIDLYDIFPTLAGNQAIAAVEDALWEGTTTTEAINRLALEVFATAADRPWWVALRLIGAAKSVWSSVHVNSAQGKPLAGWLDEVWTRIMERIDVTKKAAWLTELEEPPKGFEGEVDFDAEERAFLNAMNAVMK